MSKQAKNVAVVVGNGLSMAFNSDLHLRSITEEVLRRIQSADGNDAVAAMKEIANSALEHGAKCDDDFEVLVGAFGAESRNLEMLHKFAALRDSLDENIQKSLSDSAAYLQRVYDNGISHVLEVIAERSHATQGPAADHLQELLTAVITAFGGKVTFGNLNYDTLLLAALLQVCHDDLADIGHGQRTVTVEKGERRDFQRLRHNAGEFPPGRRVTLLHLHGSLTYWATKDNKTHVKLPQKVLESGYQWKALREHTTDVHPVVVLANQRDKCEKIGEFPFSLAYEMVSNELTQADHWLIIGYSFRDTPVNRMLQQAFSQKTQKPTVLVVTYGEKPTRHRVKKALGWRSHEDGS
ncbi:hypothetical protein C5C66_02985 [Rathayibacter toxicus]|uniref:Uncharacterized protein n=2 Tax=Rathayibacter toxicus TaxID=145458 RepID=A0A0C5BDD4_9MICO|nr:SIR2 family protein [Rathayibacter toxicus]AJM77231.1 hypothetical protein TI83_03180 [Rathayibacter toxicus]ALS56910.1 hypothetical protein APU90_03295 [Rathayibacter toxicus]KKM46255.1 hypothetical protein VT73_04200 [Rathayibacter toxicus]PPG23217.1 hypothetical protein C5D15_02960 [Rathayibacter toxicus]PPG47801.1 hypothetical protein C5D16_02955 [Rathayibacter toxicus]